MMHRLIDKKFNTPLGIVTCGLTSSHSDIKLKDSKTYENGQSEIFETQTYEIELIEFKVRLPLINGGSVTDSQGWIWRFIKKTDDLETISIDCKLNDPIANVSFDTATGEHLDAIEASDDKWILNIGTEDGETMNSRASVNDWFPGRLKGKVNSYRTISDMYENGFSTNIPDLKRDKKLYIHYICAYDYKSKNKIDTWIAVDEIKGKLEHWIGLL